MRPGGIAALFAVALVASCATRAAEVPEANRVGIDDLARQLADSTAQRPALLHVGFAPLFRAGHIPGSRYVGAGNTPEGLAALRRALKELPPGQPVVLYCGCCPWKDCPNVRPAFQVAKGSGRQDVRVLHVTGSLERDWIDQGLPAAAGED